MATLDERVQALETLLSAAAGTAPYNSSHTGPQIDSAVSRALTGGEIDGILAGKESSFSMLPINKGGTGGNSYYLARKNLGIANRIICPAGSSVTYTLEVNSTYLITDCDNMRYGAILVQTGASFVVSKTELTPLNGWSYSYSGLVITLSETGGVYDAGFCLNHVGYSQGF